LRQGQREISRRAVAGPGAGRRALDHRQGRAAGRRRHGDVREAPRRVRQGALQRAHDAAHGQRHLHRREYEPRAAVGGESLHGRACHHSAEDPGRQRLALARAGAGAMKFGLHSVNLHTCAYPEAAARLGRATEAAGFESLWVADHVVLPDPPVAGRPMAPAMRAVWTQPKPSYKGPYVTFDGVQAMPRPVQTPIPIVVGGRTPPAYRRAVSQGHGWYGFGLDVAETQKSMTALRETAKTTSRPAALGTLEISITPPGLDVPDKATVEAYAAAGVDRLILRPRPDMDVTALERFAADTGRLLGLKG